MPRFVYTWTAWNYDRSRICDCGSAIADTEAGAMEIAHMSLGGPWLPEVHTIDVRAAAIYGGPAEPVTPSVVVGQGKR